MIGETVGSYRIVSKLGVGGMGTVWGAEHVLIGKAAAVKVLHDELCHNEEVVTRFLNEARAATQIKHPGIVEVFDFGHLESGAAYLTMEYLDGMSLARRLEAREKMGEGEAALILRGVCNALQAAHAKGIIHRDLKPDNIFLVADTDAPTGERTKILDFGIAKLNEVGPAGSATKTGVVMGTPTYMSPEQCRGAGVVDHRADLYSLGCMFYEMLAGRPPFVELGAGELIGAHLFVEPEPVTAYAPEVSKQTSDLVLSLLAKEPAARPQTAKELSHLLTNVARREGWITQTAPTGITVPSVPAMRAPTPLPVSEDALSKTLPSDSGSPAPRIDKPTTLSGAASSILDVPRRTNRTLGIAMAVSAFLAGGLIAFVKIYGGSTSEKASAPAALSQPVIAPAPAPAPTPAPTAQPAVPTPIETAAPVVEPAKPPPITEPAPIETATTTAPPPKPAKLPMKAPAKPVVTTPAKPKKPKLIETDI